ncbi:MAG: preprotein translocase subunit YajC [Spirochaetaceae bacterium]|jgi:preprotein translocase subunit YajC|nr:preprotein translocase subunit YajC [Spirochaetaceae bacterium]
MYSFILPFLVAQPTGAEGGQPGAMGSLLQFLPFVLIIAIFYFLIIRPQNKKQKETQKMLAALKKGDKIETIGGIHGTISQVKEKTVIVKVDDTTKIEFNRTAVATITDVSTDVSTETESAKEDAVQDNKKSIGADKKSTGKKTK